MYDALRSEIGKLIASIRDEDLLKTRDLIEALIRSGLLIGTTPPLDRNKVQHTISAMRVAAREASIPVVGLKDEATIWAEDKFEKPDGKWEKSNNFVSAGRRPLRAFPSVWLTLAELKQIRTVYQEANLGFKAFGKALTIVDSHIRTKSLTTVGETKVNAYIALTGWILTEVLKQKNEEVKIKRNERE